MTVYLPSGSGTDWGDPNTWSPKGIPGAGDEVELNLAPMITTDGETVGSVIGSETPTVLQGTGLTVTGELSSVILDGGTYQAGNFFGMLETGQLVGGTVSGTVSGGAGTQSANFQTGWRSGSAAV